MVFKLMRGPFASQPSQIGWEWVQILLVRSHWNDNHGHGQVKGNNNTRRIPFSVVGVNLELVVEFVNMSLFSEGYWTYKDPMNMSAPAKEELLPGDHIIEINGAHGHPAALFHKELLQPHNDVLLLRVQRRTCNTQCGASTFDGAKFTKQFQAFKNNQCGCCHWKKEGKESCLAHQKLVRGR